MMSILVLVTTGTAWRTLDSLTSNLATTGALDFGPSLSGDSGAPADGATDILLVGTDSRADAQGKPLTPTELALLRAGDVATTNTDRIILVRIPNDGSSATALSIPRDSYVDVAGLGMGKINGAYGTSKENERARLVGSGTNAADAETRSTELGRKALIDTVQKLTGATIDHYAEIGLLGFILLTDAVQGVQVCLNAATADPFSGADFPAGVQTLTGPDALSFVRQRKNLPRGDLDRITRQQVFMASLARKVLSAGTLTNPAALGQLSAAVQRSVVIDSGWNVVGFAVQLSGLAGGAVRFRTIPVVNPDATTDLGVSVVDVDPDAVRAVVRSLADPAGAAARSSRASAPTTDPSAVTVDVANASGTTGLAVRVQAALVSAGYRAGTVGNTGASTTSVVLAASADDAGAAAVAGALGRLAVRADSSVARGSVRVVLGSDYAGPGSGASGAPGSTTAPPSSAAATATPAPGGGSTPIAATGGPPCVN